MHAAKQLAEPPATKAVTSPAATQAPRITQPASLQSAIGNRAMARLMQRAPAAAPPATAPPAARVRMWPTLIPLKGADPKTISPEGATEREQIVTAVRNARNATTDTMGGHWVAPKLKPGLTKQQLEAANALGIHANMTADQVQSLTLTPKQRKEYLQRNFIGGYSKTSKKVDSRQPTSFDPPANSDPKLAARLTVINQAIWEELGHEGDPGSINTYDSATLTWGQGWATKGWLQPLMTHLPAELENALLDIGVAYVGKAPNSPTAVEGWRVLDTENKVTLRGDDALQYIRFNTKILSAMYAVGQGGMAQDLIDAQAQTMFAAYDAMPAELRSLDDRLVMFIVHLNWWTGMTMKEAASLIRGKATDAAKLYALTWKAMNHTEMLKSVEHGALVVEGWQAVQIDGFGRKLLREVFPELSDGPVDGDAGKIFIKPDGLKQYIVVKDSVLAPDPPRPKPSKPA